MFGYKLGKTCTALLLFALAQPALEAAPLADRIWHGGTILTLNDAAMRAEAVAEKDGRIIATGNAADVMRTKGPRTTVVDLRGRAMLPGFVDAHGHIFLGGLQAMSANLLAPPDGGVTDVVSLQRALQDWMAANPGMLAKLGIVIGIGYDNAQMTERRHPTRDDLDAVSTRYPVIAVHQSGHLAALNSKGLELLGYTAATPDPPGGIIRRRAGGTEPDGVVEENALVPILGKLMAALGPEGNLQLAAKGAELWASYGYTTAAEDRAFAGVTEILRAAAAAGAFKNDVVAYVDVLTVRDYANRPYSRAYENRLRLGGIKLGLDGSPQGFTAWRDRPYYAPVGHYPPNYRGYAVVTDQRAIDVVDWAFANDVQVITHANGEAASDLLISAVQAATTKHGSRDQRPVLIHGQLMREDQVDSLQRLGIIPSFFPMHTFYWGDWHRDHTVGPALADNISPTGWAAKRGMRFTTHHDAPVVFPDSMRVLDATVTRRSRTGDIIGPQQRVDVITALKAMTIWPAFQHFEEADKGTIEPGKLADFVVVSADPTAVDPETLDQLQVVETIKEGRTIYRRTP